MEQALHLHPASGHSSDRMSISDFGSRLERGQVSRVLTLAVSSPSILTPRLTHWMLKVVAEAAVAQASLVFRPFVLLLLNGAKVLVFSNPLEGSVPLVEAQFQQRELIVP